MWPVSLVRRFALHSYVIGRCTCSDLCAASRRCISSSQVVSLHSARVYILPGRQSTFSQDVGLPLNERSTFCQGVSLHSAKMSVYQMSTGVTRFHREVYISTSHQTGTAHWRFGTACLRIGLEWFSVFLGTMEISVLKSKRLSKTLP